MEKTSANQSGTDFYILAGQSNMDGEGFVADLPVHLGKTFKNAWIYNPNRRDDQQPKERQGRWERLRPGHGAGFRIENDTPVYSDLFGPELSLAEAMSERSANSPILFYKYAKGGASIHPDAGLEWGCWDPDYSRGNGINQWTHFCYHLHRSLKLAEESFGAVRPAGIFWLQGESDASHTRTIAEAYTRNLSRVLNKMREEIGDMTLPVITGQISDSTMGRGKQKTTYPFGDIVKLAQKEFAEQDRHAALVTAPEGHGFIDAWHYDSQTYIDLGYRFAKAIYELRNHQLNRDCPV